MKCPHCKNSMKQKCKPYDVKGVKHGIPGTVIIYRCEACQEDVRIFASYEPRYFKMRENMGKRIREEATISSNTRIKLYEFQRDLHSGNIKRQVENLQRVLSSFSKKLP